MIDLVSGDVAEYAAGLIGFEEPSGPLCELAAMGAKTNSLDDAPDRSLCDEFCRFHRGANPIAFEKHTDQMRRVSAATLRIIVTSFSVTAAGLSTITFLP
ncbi:MAG: hypothetical protein WDM79_19010 [Terricaulis sp.]